MNAGEILNYSPFLQRTTTTIGIVLTLGCLARAVYVTTARGQTGRPQPVIRLPTEPGTPVTFPTLAPRPPRRLSGETFGVA